MGRKVVTVSGKITLCMYILFMDLLILCCLIFVLFYLPRYVVKAINSHLAKKFRPFFVDCSNLCYDISADCENIETLKH